MRTILAPALLLALLLPATAHSQPGALDLSMRSEASSRAPGAQSPYHAIPPLPGTLDAPFQSLPPPIGRDVVSPEPIGSNTIARPGYDAHILEDGRLLLDERYLHTGASSDPSVGPRVFGVFDLTDMFSPEDPYLGDKLELLHQTFAQRVALREADNGRVMDRALAALPGYLQGVWQHEDWDLATRRHILFALWDECAEEGNPLLVAGGRQARRQIEDFIAAVLPPGSADGYLDDEITAFNQTRSSLAKFAPRGQ